MFDARSLTMYSSERQVVYEAKVVEAFYNAIIHEPDFIASVPVIRPFSCTAYFYFADDCDPEDLDEDVDNLLKMVLDALNGVAWSDDKKAIHKEGGKISRASREYSEVSITLL